MRRSTQNYLIICLFTFYKDPRESIKLIFLFVLLFLIQFSYFVFSVLKNWREEAMSSKYISKSKIVDSSNSKAANSLSSSTTSSSKQFLETSIDGLSSPASSSARSKPRYFYTENLTSKENVTVTVRFRPLRYLKMCSWNMFGTEYNLFKKCLKF